MRWIRSHRADAEVVPLADRHYNRQKIGSPQFAPPGRCLVPKPARPRDDNRGQASLFAAAPELLAAAKKVNALSIQTEAHKELRAAIAKATEHDA